MVMRVPLDSLPQAGSTLSEAARMFAMAPYAAQRAALQSAQMQSTMAARAAQAAKARAEAADLDRQARWREESVRTFPSAAAGMTNPQAAAMQTFLQTGQWGQNEPLPPELQERYNLARAASHAALGSTSVNPEQYVGGLEGMTAMSDRARIIAGGLDPTRASQAYYATGASRGAPFASGDQGQVLNVVTGGAQDTPLTASAIAANRALAGERGAHADLYRAQQPYWQAKAAAPGGGRSVTGDVQMLEYLQGKGLGLPEAVSTMQDLQRGRSGARPFDERRFIAETVVKLQEAEREAMSINPDAQQTPTAQLVQEVRDMLNSIGPPAAAGSAETVTGATGEPGPPQVPQQTLPPGNIPVEQREVGKVYATPRGPMVWMGNGWMPAGT